MAAPKLERTSTPGIYRRHVKGAGGRCECAYVTTWRAHGRQHTDTRRTLAEAREAKRAHEADIARGEFSAMARVTLHEYAREWIERYQGTGRRGFREETRDGYRWNLERFALAYFPPGLKLTELSPRMVADFIGWLARKEKQGGGKLSDSGVRNAFKPLSVCLATARREGLIRQNPATDAVLPHRPPADDDEERARPFPRMEQDGESLETMELVVALVHPDYRLMFELLAATGVRRSELIAFEGRHLHLTGERPYVSVRQRVRRRKGEGLVVGPLKSRYARRDPTHPARARRPFGGAEDGRRRARIHDEHRDDARPGQSLRARPIAGVRRGRGRVGRIPHVSPHGCVAALRSGPQRGSGPALARPPLAELHA